MGRGSFELKEEMPGILLQPCFSALPTSFNLAFFAPRVRSSTVVTNRVSPSANLITYPYVYTYLVNFYVVVGKEYMYFFFVTNISRALLFFIAVEERLVKFETFESVERVAAIGKAE